ncbi:MAG TPA: hypothetical protein VFD19_04480, partial [Clostridia bacterium]|nr:hypothetical protein [Clostridia bacterium]
MDDKLNELKMWIRQWLDSQDVESSCLIPKMWAAIAQVVEETQTSLAPLASISAEQVQLLVTDDDTGRSFHRVIPLDYLETSNGITLSGETYAAQPTQIVFLTELALVKLLELQGQD